MSEYCVYRYTDQKSGEVVYIGKTDHSLSSRVNAHKKEKAFLGRDCRIDFVRLSNAVETDCVEKLLINYYKPVINCKDKVFGYTEGLSLPELNWISYEEYQKPKKRQDEKESLYQQALKDYELLNGALNYACGDPCSKSDHFTGLLPYQTLFIRVLDDGAFRIIPCLFIAKHLYECICECFKKSVFTGLPFRISVSEKKQILQQYHYIQELREEDLSCEEACKELVITLRAIGVIPYQIDNTKEGIL